MPAVTSQNLTIYQGTTFTHSFSDGATDYATDYTDLRMQIRETVTNANVVADLGDDAVNEVVSLTVDATGGTFTLSYGGETTAAISATAIASAVETAFEALSTVGAGNGTVSGGPGDAGGTTPYTITFTGTLAALDASDVTADGSGLTGGAGTATVAVTTEGTPIELVSDADSIDVTIAAAVTAAMDFTTAVYDLEGVKADGTVDRLFQGTVRLNPEVTR